MISRNVALECDNGLPQNGTNGNNESMGIAIQMVATASLFIAQYFCARIEKGKLIGSLPLPQFNGIGHNDAVRIGLPAG